MLPWMGGNYKSFLKKYSVCACDRIPEQGDLGRCEGEHDEQYTDEADGGEGELWGFAMSIPFCVRRSGKSPRPAGLNSYSAEIEQWDRPD